MFTERLAAVPLSLKRWVPCPPAAERTAWETLPESVKTCFAAAGRAALAEKIPALPLTLWLDFSRTGTRAAWETAYFARRRMLAGLVCAECTEYKGQYLDAIRELIWAICEESAWQLPAHNSYIRDTPQLPLPDVTRPIVELFAAETGELLAITRYLLGSELDAGAPGLSARIGLELERRILTPYLHSHFWWMGSGNEPMCNWTSWCTQNVLVTAFLASDEQSLWHAVIEKATYSLDCFLKDYGPDGCCNEGAQYYRHAGLTLWGALSILSTAAPDAFGPLFREEKIRNVAEYICRMHAAGPYYLNFGDCSPLAGRCGAREYRFGQAVGSDALTSLAAADHAADADPDHLTAQDGSSAINLWYRLIGAFAEAELCKVATDNTPNANKAAREESAKPRYPSSTFYYPSTGIYGCRAGAFILGAKMGSNGDSHNHNDTGSFTLYKNGRPYCIDIGVESYTRKTFSPQRYEIWTMQSAWHNLPTFDGVMQRDGAAFAAREVLPGESGISAELSGAYPPIAGLSYYRRSLTLCAKGLTLSDESDYPGPIALTLMTAEKPAPIQGGLQIGTLGQITPGESASFAAAGITAEIETVPITDARLATAWPEAVYRIILTFKNHITLCIG